MSDHGHSRPSLVAAEPGSRSDRVVLPAVPSARFRRHAPRSVMVSNHDDMSRVALDRIVTERSAADPAYRATLAAAGRPVRDDLRALDDDTICARLLAQGLAVDRRSFAELTRGHESAEDLAMVLLAELPQPVDEDWLWCALAVLWERWQPDHPGCELLDDRMQAGYQMLEEHESTAALDLWLAVWRNFMQICTRQEITSVRALDQAFGGSQSVFNWMQDLEVELWNASQDQPDRLRQRVGLCGEMLARFHDLDPMTVSNCRDAIVESLEELHEGPDADARFEALVAVDPADPGPWLAWAQMQEPAPRAINLLERALAVPELREPALVQRQLDRLVSRQAAGLRRATKVGRNDRCPCGSGRKYKHCCLLRGAGPPP